MKSTLICQPTPYDQWVNIAIGHLQGRASTWLKHICLPWQTVTWQQFCNMLADRFTKANVHEAVEQLKNIKQQSSIDTYIDSFEESVALVKRDHPFIQENFLLSCYIGGLRSDIKHDVCGQKPSSIMECYWYSKIYEKTAARKHVSPPYQKNRQYPPPHPPAREQILPSSQLSNLGFLLTRTAPHQLVNRDYAGIAGNLLIGITDAKLASLFTSYKIWMMMMSLPICQWQAQFLQIKSTTQLQLLQIRNNHLN